MGKLIVVVGGQFGSEGKGAIAGWLAAREPRLLAVRVGGPNAGHTVYGPCPPESDQGTHEEGAHRYPLRQLPVAAVTRPDASLAIAAGSEVDPALLRQEMALFPGKMAWVDRQATWLEEHYHVEEDVTELQKRIGSTSKGIGAARAARIWREARLIPQCDPDYPDRQWGWSDVAGYARDYLDSGGVVMLEGAQGYGLGLHAGFYPYCTSIDCRAVDVMAQAGVVGGRHDQVEVWLVVRTFPIRVAGNSGPLENETTWEELNQRSNGYIQPEYTTVTQKQRRVGRLDLGLVQRAIAANRGPWDLRVALTMLDYKYPRIAGDTGDLPRRVLDDVGLVAEMVGAPIQLVGTGPRTVVDLR
jgi:adenylosuccinate synthase